MENFRLTRPAFGPVVDRGGPGQWRRDPELEVDDTGRLVDWSSGMVNTPPKDGGHAIGLPLSGPEYLHVRPRQESRSPTFLVVWHVGTLSAFRQYPRLASGLA